MDKWIIREFEMLYPYLVKYVEEYNFDECAGELIVVFKDGRRKVYNKLCGTLEDISGKHDIVDERTYKKEFGMRLQRIMQVRQISQNELSSRTGISQGMISNYIKGLSIPNAYNAMIIAETLNCAIEDLQY